MHLSKKKSLFSFRKKTKQNIVNHTSVLVLFLPVLTDSFSFENAYSFIRLRLSLALKNARKR